MQIQECIQNIFPSPVIDFLRQPLQDIARAFTLIETKVQQVAQSVISAIEWSKTVVTHLSLLFISNHVLSGLCKITGYEVLEHGTSWNSYLSILQNGADPARGGETTAASLSSIPIVLGNDDGQYLSERAKRKFYVTKDTESPDCFSTFIPMLHSGLAYVKEYKKFNQIDNKTSVPIVVLIGCVFAAMFTPKIRFIYSLKEMHGTNNNAIFENDPDYDGNAYQTFQALPSDRIGLVGLVTHMNQEHVFRHLQNNPLRVAQGVAQVALGVLLTATGLGFLF